MAAAVQPLSFRGIYIPCNLTLRALHPCPKWQTIGHPALLQVPRAMRSIGKGGSCVKTSLIMPPTAPKCHLDGVNVMILCAVLFSPQ